MKTLLTIGMLAIIASIGLTAILDNALAQKDPRGGSQIAKKDPRGGQQIGQGLPPSSPNNWGKVVSGFAQGGSFGQHSSNPIPDDPDTLPQDIDRDTPRSGVGNQEPGKHPAFHADRLCNDFPRAPGCDNIE